VLASLANRSVFTRAGFWANWNFKNTKSAPETGALFMGVLGRAAAWPVVARAQQPERIRRIGVLHASSGSDPESQRRTAPFVDGLQKFGWKDGTNILIDYRWAGDDADRIRLYATELTGMRPDVIWTSGALPLLLQAKFEDWRPSRCILRGIKWEYAATGDANPAFGWPA
jgi:hypothetical protein